MTYGLTNAPAPFQRLFDRLVGTELYPQVFVYLDDIIVVTQTFDSYLIWLKHVLNKIRAAGLTINTEKSEFCHAQVRSFGCRVNCDGLQVDPDKVAPIVKYPAPRNLKQLLRFLGIASWDFSLPFTLQTDASSVGLGAVLTQNVDSNERVIAYASRSLTAAQQRYTVTEQECLAVIWAIRKFRCYLEGYAFTVITDHSSLRGLHNLKKPTIRLARWALELR